MGPASLLLDATTNRVHSARVVASADSLVRKGWRLSAREEEFCRLVVVERLSQVEAYVRAYGCINRESARTLAARILQKPHIRKQVQELRAAANQRAVYTMARRRDALARMIDAGITPAKLRKMADPQLALAAIREDAILAGERNEQSTVTADVSILAVMRAISTVGGEANAAAIDIATLEAQGGALGAPPPLYPSPPVSEAAGPIAAPMAGHAAPLCSVDLDLEDE